MTSRSTSKNVLLLSFIIQIGLLLYANHVDTHPERFGGLKYTDVDWLVVSDGARMIFSSDGVKNVAQGWLVRSTGWNVGDPYNRATFRYTPLLPLLLSPTLIHRLLGKLVLIVISLAVPPVLLWTPNGRSTHEIDQSASFWPIHLLWTLNPFVLNITTRGSPEAVVVLLVVATVACLRAAGAVHTRGTEGNPNRFAARWEIYAGILYALSISYKIYPIIYVPAIWASLSERHGWFGQAVWRFGFVTVSGLILVNGALWLIWGQPFLQHTFLYHFTRLDHRHNFSSYFYPIYLSLFLSTGPSPPSLTLAAIRHPLSSFVPQFGIVLSAGFLLTPRTGLVFAMFLQTAAFVVFNKVCTSQYFMWFLPFLPILLPRLDIPRRKAILMVGLWIAGQAVWLGTAYQLEFLVREVYLSLWGAGVGLFVISVWVLGEILEGFDARPRTRKEI